MDQIEIAQQLCAACRLFGERQWCLATSGNFSARIAQPQFLITKSGREKSALKPDDLMLCEISGAAADPECKPSAETPLHACLYQLDESIGAVLHTHSVAATVLSRAAESEISVTGFEMQKALAGFESHEQVVAIPVFDNDQDMDALAKRLTFAWHEGLFVTPGFLIRGHGLYAWGADVAAARRHVEGFEFLLSCLLSESRIQ